MSVLLALAAVTATPFQPLPGIATPGPAGGWQEQVALAASPGPNPVLLAVWNDLGAGQYSIHATRVDPVTLALLDGPTDVVLAPSDAVGKPEVAFGGHSFDPNGYFLVAWNTWSKLRTVRITLDGGVSMPVLFNTSNAGLAVLASDGDAFVEAYLGAGSVLVTVLSADGATMSGELPLASAPNAYSVSLTSARPGSFYAVWTEEQGGNAPSSVRGCGMILGVDGGTLTTGNPVTLFTSPTILCRAPTVTALPDGGYQAAWLAGSYSTSSTVQSVAINGGMPAAWADGGQMPGYAEERVSLQYGAPTPSLIAAWGNWDTGAMLGSVPPAGTGPAQPTQVARAGVDPVILVHSGALFVGYERGGQFDGASDDILLEKRDLSGAPLLGPVMLSRSLTQQVTAAVARSGDDVMVMFEEYHADSGYDVMAQRLDAGVVTVDGAPGHQSWPVIAGSDAGIYMAAWVGDPSVAPNLFAARFDTTGTQLGPTVNPQGSSFTYGVADVAYGEGVFIVVWTSSINVYYRRYALDGTALDAMPIPLGGSATRQAGHAHVARVGSTFVVAWDESPSGGGLRTIAAARVTFAGAILDPTGNTAAVGCGRPESLAVGGEGDDAVMAWRDNRSGQYEIWGARMRGGVGIDDGGVRWVPPIGADPALVYSAERDVALSEVPGGVLLVYADNGVSALHLVQGVPLVTEVLVSGIPVDSLAVVSNAHESVVAAALSRTPGPPGTTYRVEVSHLTRFAPGSSCNHGFDCETGVCTLNTCAGDAGVPPDAGPGTDAGPGLDAGPGSDGGTPRPPLNVHCGCDEVGMSAVGLALLAGLRRRRRPTV
jgi:MYXO-CTERM domain-containing protein